MKFVLGIVAIQGDKEGNKIRAAGLSDPFEKIYQTVDLAEIDGNLSYRKGSSELKSPFIPSPFIISPGSLSI